MNAVRGRTPWASDGASPAGSPSSSLHALGFRRDKPVWEPEFLAARLGLQTGRARLGAVRGEPVWEPFGASPTGNPSSSCTHWASDGASPSGSRSGQARLGARLVFVGTVPDFLNGREPVRRLAAAVSL